MVHIGGGYLSYNLSGSPTGLHLQMKKIALIKDITNKISRQHQKALNPKCVQSSEFGALCD